MTVKRYEIKVDPKWRKLSRGNLKPWAIGRLITVQDRKCALCYKPIDMTSTGVKADMVVDHCHEIGLVRGVLHKSCNSAEGRIVNAAGRWGAKSTQYADVIPFLENLVRYLKESYENPTGVIYPDYKTPEQKAEATRVKRNKAAAVARAKAKVKRNQEV